LNQATLVIKKLETMKAVKRIGEKAHGWFEGRPLPSFLTTALCGLGVMALLQPPFVGAASFTNVNVVTINDASAANPYPSTISVSGVSGNVTNATVTLWGMGHDFSSDISILLVAPQGQKVVLMSEAGGANPVASVNITFDDTAVDSLPMLNQSQPTGVWRTASSRLRGQVPKARR
jgi:hypothetical protein